MDQIWAHVIRIGLTVLLLGALGWLTLRGRTGIIARRELVSVFTRPMAYVFGAVFLAVVGIVFSMGFEPGGEASMHQLFVWMAKALVVVIPILTMPLLSEEYSRGTIETMMTAPVGESQLVLGKFAAALAFYVFLIAATALHMVMLMAYGQPELGQAWMGYIGMGLIGACFISIGLFFSSLTRDQMLAAVLSMVVLAAVVIVPDLIRTDTPEHLRGVLDTVNASAWFESFSKGIFEVRSLVFFASVTLFFLFVSVKVLESRRWR
jgi:ABC-2 type transport system permease protein